MAKPEPLSSYQADQDAIRVNLLAFNLCGVYSSSAADEAKYIYLYRRNFPELIK
jgi:hypothetical protein